MPHTSLCIKVYILCKALGILRVTRPYCTQTPKLPSTHRCKQRARIHLCLQVKFCGHSRESGNKYLSSTGHVMCLCMCVSGSPCVFWTWSLQRLGSLDVWLWCKEHQEASPDSSLQSNRVLKSSCECWWSLNTVWNHQPNLGPDKYAKKGSQLTLPLNAFPSPAVSCCPVTRCRGRQVYLVWQVTLHPGSLQFHVRLTLMLRQLSQVLEDRMHLGWNALHSSVRPSLEES